MAEESISVLYNDSRGYWTPSDKVIELYNKKMKENDPNFKELKLYQFEYIDRHDPVLIDIYIENREEFDDELYSLTKMKTFPKKYENYYTISSYNNGPERIIIDHLRYEKDEIIKGVKEILKNEMTNDNKIIELNKILF